MFIMSVPVRWSIFIPQLPDWAATPRFGKLCPDQESPSRLGSCIAFLQLCFGSFYCVPLYYPTFYCSMAHTADLRISSLGQNATPLCFFDSREAGLCFVLFCFVLFSFCLLS